MILKKLIKNKNKKIKNHCTYKNKYSDLIKIIEKK